MDDFFFLAAACLAGVASHVLYFNRGEHHMLVARYVVSYTGAFVISTFALGRVMNDTVGALWQVSWLSLWYLAGLYTSLFAYRLLFHPTKHFPGPLAARVSSLWLVSKLGNLDAHRQLDRLHKMYGDFVCVGSSELSVNSPGAVQALYGQTSRCTKGTWYDTSLPVISLFTMRNRAGHDRRRRIWSPAFSDQALRGYEQRMKKYREVLFSKLDAFQGAPVNLSKWFDFYSYDVMGDLAFADSFQMLERSEAHWAPDLMKDGFRIFGYRLPEWLMRLAMDVPGATRGFWRMVSYCTMRAEKRRETKVEIPDIMASILKPFNGRPPVGDEVSLMAGESMLIISAGSDTTAITLTNTILELLRNPGHIGKLRDELDALLESREEKDLPGVELARLPHLNGIIWEVLRMYPPVPTGAGRVTPPEGIEIDGTFIPGNMTVFCSQYVLGRNSTIYRDPDAFVPERWYSRGDMVRNGSAWAPFLIGPYSCIGRPLALLNIRITVARFVTEYDFAFAPGVEDNGRSVEREAEESFVCIPGPLNVCLRKRQRAGSKGTAKGDHAALRP